MLLLHNFLNIFNIYNRMNLIITNYTVNIDSNNIAKYSTKISKGDNKSLLYTLPYIPFTNYGWVTLRYELLKFMKESVILKKISLALNSNEEIKTILFFRANTFISKNYDQIKKLSGIKKIIYVDDLHNSMEMRELRELDPNIFDSFDLILSTYAYCFDKFFPKVPKEKVYWFPHSFNEQLKIDYNPNPINKILLCGCICDSYPMRQKVANLKDIFPIDILEHPKYSKNKLHDIIGKKFIQKLNEYRAVFTCCLNVSTPYLVQKFFEIPGSGALLIAYDKWVEEPLKELGFVDMENYLSVNEENLEEKISFIFDEKNFDLIESIRINGYNFIHEKHTHQIRTDKLIEYINKK